MADALDKLQAGADKARRKLAAQRLGGRELDVKVETRGAVDQVTGMGGSWSAPLTLDPRPVTELGAVFRQVDGVTTRIGDAKVSGISRSLTEEQLRGTSSAPAARWTVGAVRYTLVELTKRPTEWRAVLKREEG